MIMPENHLISRARIYGYFRSIPCIYFLKMVLKHNQRTDSFAFILKQKLR
jgi:hypothetical protein